MNILEPAYFGPNNRILGLYYPAQGSPRGESVLIIPPPFAEHLRTHWALRQLAGALAESGFDVLRIEPAGIGNSLIKTTDLLPGMWLEDIEAALAELADISGSDQANIVAVRFSAYFAAQFASDSRVKRCIFWEPVLTPAAFVDFATMLNGDFGQAGVNDFCLGYRTREDFLASISGLPTISGFANCSAIVGQPISYELAEKNLTEVQTLIDDVTSAPETFDWRSTVIEQFYPHDTVRQLKEACCA